MKAFKDISYGNHERQKVDIFIPANVKNSSGVILYIHGGGWHSGDKQIHNEDAEYFCKLGYISAAMNYRYVDDATTVFHQLDDITDALKAVQRKCAQFGFNAEKLLLSGGSAGAQLALLYAYTRSENAPLTPVAVCAYCPPVKMEAPDFLMGISGEFEEWKYDILSKCCGIRISKNDFLCEQLQSALKKISPMEYVSENCVPTAVFHGRNDELVPFEHIVDFVARLNEKGVENEFLIYENSGHAQDKDPETKVKSKFIIKSYAEKYF